MTLIEHPPILDYAGSSGRICFIPVDDQLRAADLQARLRTIGRPMSAADLLIAAVCSIRDRISDSR